MGKASATGRRSRSSRRSGALHQHYGRLLPGITNVTDRARYYSFYPWLIWAFDEAGFTRYDDEFIERFRRADCLFSLIAERHAATAGGPYEDHAAAMVGSNTLAAVASSLESDGKITLSDYSLRDGARARYFLNRLRLFNALN